MKKVSRIITTAAVLGMAVVAASCSKSGGKGGSSAYNFEMWTGFGSDYTQQIDSVVNKFNEKHNGSIYIKHEKKGDYDSLLTQVLNSVSTSTFPNFACGYPDHFAEYWKKGIINPLDDYIKRYDQEHGTDLMKDYYTQYMRENKEIAYDDDGNQYTLGLPFNKSTEVMLCNGYYFDYFKSFEPSLVVPQTWDQLAEIAPKLYKIATGDSSYGSVDLRATSSNYIIGVVGNDGHASNFRVSDSDSVTGNERVIQEVSKIALDKDFYALGYDSADNAFITILHQWNVPYTSYSYSDYVNNNQYGKALFWQSANQAGTRNALQFFVDLNSAHGFGVPATFGEKLYCTTPLEQGRCLFTIGSSGGLNKPDFAEKRLDIHPIPYKDAAHKAVISQGTSLGLLNRYESEENYEEEMYQAFSSMVELTTGELQAAWVTKTGYFPSSDSAYKDPAYQALLHNDNPTRLESLYRDAGNINATTYAEGGWDRFVDPGFCGSNSIRVAVKKVLQQIMSGEKTIDGALGEVWSTIDEKVK